MWLAAQMATDHTGKIIVGTQGTVGELSTGRHWNYSQRTRCECSRQRYSIIVTTAREPCDAIFIGAQSYCEG